jgi:transposase
MLDKALLKIVRRDKVCQKFMTVPSVGPIVAITYKTAVDDPHRIKKSKGTGPLFVLTPRVPIGRAHPRPRGKAGQSAHHSTLSSLPDYVG